MMFLQYALWGAWLPVTARYLSASIEDGGLGFSGSDIGCKKRTPDAKWRWIQRSQFDAI